MNKTLEERVTDIEARNLRVSQDKAWETSWTRRITITLLAYVVVVSFMWVTDQEAPLISAVVPAGVYLLSTMVLSNIRSLWRR